MYLEISVITNMRLHFGEKPVKVQIQELQNKKTILEIWHGSSRNL